MVTGRELRGELGLRVRDIDIGSIALRDAAGGERRVFNLNAPPEAAFRSARASDAVGLTPPRRAGGLQVEALLDDFGYKQPVRVNGRPLALKAFQSVRSWASDSARAVLGTQWSVLTADAAGQVL